MNLEEKFRGLVRTNTERSVSPPDSPRRLESQRSLLKMASFRSTSSENVPHYALPTTNSFRLQTMNSFRASSPRSGSNSPPSSRDTSPKHGLSVSFSRAPTFEQHFIIPEPPEPASIRSGIDAQLVINSLILLGFDSDEYIKTYSGIAYDLIPLNRETFHNSGGDKMLLIVLHYLLCILDPELFLLDIKSCWPYLDARERNVFKGAVNTSIKRLIDQEVIPNDVYQPAYLNNHDKHATWSLLRALTDVCLDNMLPEKPPGEDLLYSESNKEVLLDTMENQLQKVIGMMSTHQDLTDEYRAYLQELVDRVHAANRLISKQQQSKERIDNNNVNHHSNIRNKKKILGAKGVKLRQDKIDLINKKKDLLKGFMDSELLQHIEKFLEQDAEDMRVNGKAHEKRALRKAKTMTAEDLEQYKEQMKDSITQLVNSIEAVCDLV